MSVLRPDMCAQIFFVEHMPAGMTLAFSIGSLALDAFLGTTFHVLLMEMQPLSAHLLAAKLTRPSRFERRLRTTVPAMFAVRWMRFVAFHFLVTADMSEQMTAVKK